MFSVTTMFPLKEGEKIEKKLDPITKQLDYNQDFFKKPAFLTVSGQLNVENFCCSLSNVYTFGPTFRAEDSHTTRHLAEFWMIEPELAFADLSDVMDCGEAYVKFCLKYVLNNNRQDLEFLTEWLKQSKDEDIKERKDLVKFISEMIEKPFARVSYTDAIEILKSAIKQGKKFEKPVDWGTDLATEHERFLAEVALKQPVFVYNYPRSFKAFYMKLNDDKKTVASCDLLCPLVGELIGGSQREELLDVLVDSIKLKNLDMKSYWWYLNLRKYGTIQHGGFGLGFERLIMMCTGMQNIRDVIPFPRFPGSAEF